MSSKIEQLKEIRAEKKKLIVKQKALKQELDLTRTERKQSRKVQAKSRVDVRQLKSDLRDLTSDIYDAFSEGDPEVLENLANGILDVSKELSDAVRNFGEAAKYLEDL